MNRIDRISAILIQLQSRRVVKAVDIAERFNISLRTVYRDIRTLEEAGVPLIGEAGVGYSLMDGYRLPPVMFTRDEAVAFLTAEKLMEKLTDPTSDENYKSAMFKIRAVLKGAEKDMLENMDDRIEVLKSARYTKASTELSPLPVILKCIAQRQVIGIKYFANHSREESERFIEPVGVFMVENFWHLIAWCRLREDYRDFRLDRMLDITPTTERFRQLHPNLKDFINKSANEQNLHTIIVRVESKVMPFIEGQKYYNGFVSEEQDGDITQMTFLTQWIEGFARWFITYADFGQIITPPELKEKVREIAMKIVGE